MSITVSIKGYACLSTDMKYPAVATPAPMTAPLTRRKMKIGCNSKGKTFVKANMAMIIRQANTVKYPHAKAG
jgi:hypothetical protein